MALIGSSILRSIGRKCQTAEIRVAESECSDEPAALVGPHPAHLKQQLRGSFGKGSAARKGAQRQRGIGLRTRAKSQAAAGPADVNRRTKLGEKPAVGREAAYGESKYGRGSGFAAPGTQRPAPGRLIGRLSRDVRPRAHSPRRTNHLGPLCAAWFADGSIDVRQNRGRTCTKIVHFGISFPQRGLARPPRTRPRCHAPTAKTVAMNFLCKTRTFDCQTQGNVTECG
jgi:hypothetical protein